ncbi:DUF6332 family protein [Streptomyces sp. NBC_00390]|uniref:DUF6332 family protein n=1 Tax=Streptomyces sp. NBC_00390 TaxID=2975736 RepID=UPI002E1B2C2B
MERRTQAERDAITVEIGYALVSGFVVAGLTFLGIAGPTTVFALPHAAERGLVVGGAVVGAVAFVLRVVHVLWRFARTPDQPSQPGRTSPDS